MKTSQKTLKDLSELFLYFMFYTKKISPHTLKAYKTDLQELLNFKWAEKNLFFTQNFSDSSSVLEKEKTTPFHLKIEDKKQLAKTIKSSIEKNSTKYFKLANSSKNRKLAVIKSFIKWLAEENHIEEDFRHLFKSPKVSSRIPSFLSVDEIFSVLAMFKKEEGKAHTARDKALFFLLYGGGLRVSEACRLKNKNIDWTHQVLKIEGKGNKERLISLPQRAFEHIKALKSDQTYLFGVKPLSERKAYDIIKSIGQRTGLLKPLHPHALRHSFATHILLGGADLRVVQELLGHKSLTATQKYTHLDLARLSKTLEDFHPLLEKDSRSV